MAGLNMSETLDSLGIFSNAIHFYVYGPGSATVRDAILKKCVLMLKIVYGVLSSYLAL